MLCDHKEQNQCLYVKHVSKKGSKLRHSIARAVLATTCAAAIVALAVPENVSASEAGPAAGDTGRAEAFRIIEAWLQASMAFRKVPGMSVGVVAGDELIWAKGFGTTDAAGRVPATPSSVYSICSISKVFTAISVMQLVEADKVQLDKPITDVLPWATFKETDPSSGPVTLRGLLTHSAGVPREAGFEYWAGPDFTFPTRDQIRDTFADQTKLFGTYQHYQYSNLGLTLAGEVVAERSGQPYERYVRDNVLLPLGLGDTTTALPMDLYGKRLAVGHGYLKRDGTRDTLKPFDAKGVMPAAGFASTVEDLARFVRWQFRLLRTGTTEVLQPGTLRDMQRVQFLSPDWRMSRGLGFGVYRQNDKTYVGHSGECPGYYTRFMMDMPSETAVIVMINAAEPTAPYTNGIFDILGKRKGFSFKGTAPASIDLEPYVGLYSTQPWGAEQMIMPWAGGLVALSLPSDAPAREMTFLKPDGTDSFRRVRDDGSVAEAVRFERGRDGKVRRIIWHANPSLRIADL